MTLYRKLIGWFFFFLPLFTARAEGEGRFRLFSEDVKRDYPSVVYDFLERYLYKADSLEQHGELTLYQQVADNVRFIHGTPKRARQLTPVTPFTMNFVNQRYYDVCWKSETGDTLLHVAFPASFELLWGLPKNKLERILPQQLRCFDKRWAADRTVTESDLEPGAKKGFWENRYKEYYELEEIHNATYYQRDAHQQWVPVFSEEYPLLAAFNLWQGVLEEADDYQLHIRQSVYPFDELTYTLSLSQWLHYVRSIKGRTYIGLEENRADACKLLVMVVCPDLGFKHMLSVVMKHHFVSHCKEPFEVKLNAFIPMHNVKAIYKEKELLKNVRKESDKKNKNHESK